MARLLEHDAKAILAARGIPVPRGQAVSSPEEARRAAVALGRPVVVKALVPVGKRGKSGAVRLAADPEAAGEAAAALLGREVGGFPVERVLVEEAVPVAGERYLAIVLDADGRTVRVLAGREGGIEVEELARREGGIASLELAPCEGLMPFHARQLWRSAGVRGPALPRLGQLTAALHRTFIELEAELLEINPLAETAAGELVATGAVVALDEAALFRQPELAERVVSGPAWRPPTALERQVAAINAAEPYRGSARYLELEGGDIAFLCGGGGASLLLFDALLRAGGRPANYAEIGGNPTEMKVAALARVVLSKPGVRGLFVAHNLTNNTQVDVLARGVVQALCEAGRLPPDFPVVARETGVNEAEGRAIFEAAGVRWLGEEVTLSEAARIMVQAMRERYGESDGDPARP
ncbi:Succinate--CoA ligase [GDP-forming] subunit beta [bacterium HR26]|nr:Succinate--CoA ligase [GDP-forming] subunit beta [bacterium HR26]